MGAESPSGEQYGGIGKSTRARYVHIVVEMHE